VSLGVSAIGQIGNLYIQNHKSLASYHEAIDRGVLPSYRGATMSADDTLRKDVIQQIMCHGTINIPATEQRFGIEFETYFHVESARLAALEADGLIERSDRTIDLTPRGRLLMRNVAMAFDAYSTAGAQKTPQSRVI
jgi:oxygen-independent coproporphyrinogen-3 oxidase